ncbi:hypothetical protein U1839_19265 [Sphingomonas sp. RT2P30]|uniref:hypothetical protein n=1 Tax=Parasphingomonas halimpatiens TaxID=3096162 RepID=UPI002FC7AEA7
MLLFAWVLVILAFFILAVQMFVTIIQFKLTSLAGFRGLRMGLPIRLVAAIHDTSVAMIERHYSRWITEGFLLHKHG